MRFEKKEKPSKVVAAARKKNLLLFTAVTGTLSAYTKNCGIYGSPGAVQYKTKGLLSDRVSGIMRCLLVISARHTAGEYRFQLLDRLGPVNQNAISDSVYMLLKNFAGKDPVEYSGILFYNQREQY